MTPDRKRVVITAAAGGIGAALAEAFAAEGARLVICDINTEGVEAVAARLRVSGAAVTAHTCDVADGDQLAAFAAAALEELGTVDVLVNNAGGSGPGAVTDIGLAEWRAVMALNLDSAFVLSNAFIPGMQAQRWGRLIQIASLGGKRPFPNAAAYSTSKAAMIALTRSMAMDYVKDGITSNAVCPSWTRSDMSERFANMLIDRDGITRDEAYELMAGMNPHNAVLEPEEVARVAVMLAGDGAASINGQAISVDGGAALS